jgi:hypothetical protein
MYRKRRLPEGRNGWNGISMMHTGVGHGRKEGRKEGKEGGCDRPGSSTGASSPSRAAVFFFSKKDQYSKNEVRKQYQ